MAESRSCSNISHNYSRVYYHFIWAVWDRQPFLEGEIERHAYALIRSLCSEMNCNIHALSGPPDHVHLVVSLPHTLCISEFIQRIKGCSTRAINEAHETDTWAFHWQRGYGVLTVSQGHLKDVIHYVENQKEHHRAGKLWVEAETITEDD